MLLSLTTVTLSKFLSLLNNIFLTCKLGVQKALFYKIMVKINRPGVQNP